VVATDVGGVREAIVEGETGYIVPSGDDRMMAERIIQLLADDELARMMGKRGKVLVAEKFSKDRHLQNTLELYDELLAERGSSARRNHSSVRGTNRETNQNELALKPHRNQG
jgi:glycosyltransferase involved in cell wall biosynthesis